MKYKFGDRLEIQWVDIETRCSWTDIKDAINHSPKLYFDIGYYLNEDKESFRIYNSIDGDKEDVSYTVFPKGCIKKIIKLGDK